MKNHDNMNGQIKQDKESKAESARHRLYLIARIKRPLHAGQLYIVVARQIY
jgi:hypothetical protein